MYWHNHLGFQRKADEPYEPLIDFQDWKSVNNPNEAEAMELFVRISELTSGPCGRFEIERGDFTQWTKSVLLKTDVEALIFESDWERRKFTKFLRDTHGLQMQTRFVTFDEGEGYQAYVAKQRALCEEIDGSVEAFYQSMVKIVTDIDFQAELQGVDKSEVVLKSAPDRQAILFKYGLI